MSNRLLPAILMLATLLLPATGFAASEPVSVSSPDGRIRVHLSVKEKLDPYPAGTGLYYSVSVDGREILLDSPFGIDFKDMPPIARDLAIKNQSRRSVRETWKPVCGKSSQVLDHYNELQLALEETREPGRRIEFIVRAYDDGIAFRYYLPAQPSLGSFLLTSERSKFRFAGNHTVWTARYDTFVGHQENEFDRISLSRITPANTVGILPCDKNELPPAGFGAPCHGNTRAPAGHDGGLREPSSGPLRQPVCIPEPERDGLP